MDRVIPEEALVRRLLAAQFPHWAELPVRAVVPGGHDHRTFRIGDALSARLPTGEWYALQVAKEQRWLPELAPRLPFAIPSPVALGVPGDGYPFEWSVYGWLEGEPASPATIGDGVALAVALAEFLRALGAVPAEGGPPPGPHSFHRGGPVAFYEGETLAAVEALGGAIPREAVLSVWAEAVGAAFDGKPVWFHGDVAEGNLLLRDGRLAAVIDFGTCGVGDPACDLVIAWTLLRGRARSAFREALGCDAETWARGRGWALWKALITEDLATVGEVLEDVANVNGAG